MRTNPQENQILGEILAKKLNHSAGPTAVLFPQKGLSQIDAEGNVFYNPVVNQILSDSIEKNLNSDIAFINLPLHINEKEFARKAVETLMEMMK